MTDEQKVCVDCGKPFTWTDREQEFWRQKKLEHPPKRCGPCRVSKRGRRGPQPQAKPAAPSPLADVEDE